MTKIKKKKGGAKIKGAISKKFVFWAGGIFLLALVIIILIMISSRGSDDLSQKVLQKESFKIGVILPLTGDSAYGLTAQRPLLLAQKEINNSGGIGDRSVELLWEDGRCEADLAKDKAEKLVNINKVDTLIAGGCSGEVLAAAPIAQTKGIVSFSATATSPDISKLGKNFFRTCPSDALAGKVTAEYAYSGLNARKAGVIVEKDPFPEGLKKVFSEEFERLGGEVVMIEVVTGGATDFVAIAKEMKSLEPDVVYVVSQQPTVGVSAIKALKDKKTQAQLMTAEVFLMSGIIKEHSKVLDGVIGVQPFFDVEAPKTKGMFERYKQEFEVEASRSFYTAGLYDLPFLIKEAYESTGDVRKMGDYLYRLRNWEGAVGKVNFDENGDNNVSYSVRKIDDGKVIDIETYTISD